MLVNGLKINFSLKKPDKTRRSFVLVKKITNGNISKFETVQNVQLKALNLSFKQNKISESDALSLAKQIHAALYDELRPKSMANNNNPKNETLFDKYWNEEYADRDLVDSRSIKNDFKRAIKALGAISIQTGSREEISKCLQVAAVGNAQRRLVDRINTLLKYTNRPFKIKKNREVKTDVAHLSLVDFKKMSKFIENANLKLLAEAAFYSGLRVGELFAVKPNQIRGSFLIVKDQVDRELARREPKNRRERKAFMLKEGKPMITEWVSLEDKNKIRNTKFATVIKNACKKAFPEDRAKWIAFHDLRHSYAIHLLSKGVSISLVAQSLGNSVVVCEKHYSGFTLMRLPQKFGPLET